MARLIPVAFNESGGHKEIGRVYPITKELTLIGADPNCDIVINDSKVSRKHAYVIREGNDFYLGDTSRCSNTRLARAATNYKGSLRIFSSLESLSFKDFLRKNPCEMEKELYTALGEKFDTRVFNRDIFFNYFINEAVNLKDILNRDTTLHILKHKDIIYIPRIYQFQFQE